MSWSNLLAITPYPGMSLFVVLLVASLLLYFARQPARAGLLHAGYTLYQACRMASRSFHQAASRLRQRNREVLLEQGREAAGRAVEREFERIEHSVRKELGDYPALHRQVSEAITAIEEDYERSREVPPPPPGWTEAVAAVTRIPRAEGLVGKLLEGIQEAVEKMEGQAIRAYRHDSRERHRLLSRARPLWQALVRHLGGAEKKVQRLLDRASSIDNHMANYAEINRGEDAALRRLSSSSLMQFFVSLFVLAVAAGGAVINFNLIARPMAEMVGGTSAIGNMRVADIAALVIILVEISMGLFLMESLRITRLFPVIGALDDRLRVRMIWISLGILTALATVEAGLAFMREILVQDELATSALLRGDQAAIGVSNFTWITTVAQMGMGFVLPFALTFVAIPLETFVHSLRTLAGMLTIALLISGAVSLRILGVVLRGLSRFLAALYDVLVFLPLWVERMVVSVRRHRNDVAAEPEESAKRKKTGAQSP